jgi:hypothetical protein
MIGGRYEGVPGIFIHAENTSSYEAFGRILASDTSKLEIALQA